MKIQWFIFCLKSQIFNFLKILLLFLHRGNNGWNFYLLQFFYLNCSLLTHISLLWGRRVIGISGSLIWSKTLLEQMYNPCGEFPWSPKGPVSQIHSPHLHAGAPGFFSDRLRSVQMLKREWGAESNGTLPHLFIPSTTSTSVPEFAMEDLALGRTAALVPECAVKDLPRGRTFWWLWWWWWYNLSSSSSSSSSSECSAQGKILHCKRRKLNYSCAEYRPSNLNSGTKAAVLPGIE